MNATQILLADNEEVMTLLNALVLRNSGGDDSETTETVLYCRLKDALELHVDLEEQILYPALQGFPETMELLNDSCTSHKYVRQLLSEMTPGTRLWSDGIVELRKQMERHAEDEEKVLFPKAAALLGELQLQLLGQDIQAMKAGRKGGRPAAA